MTPRTHTTLCMLLTLLVACAADPEIPIEGGGDDSMSFEMLDLITTPDRYRWPDTAADQSGEPSPADAEGTLDVEGDVPHPPADTAGADGCVPVTLYFDSDSDGYGTGNGFQSCETSEGFALQDGDCDDSDPARNPGEPELCDGIDNDCDEETDEGCDCQPGESVPCGSDLGICQAGTRSCTDGSWGPCAGEVVPQDEICDGQDNDCDGDTDEGCQCTNGATETCGSAVGQCQQGTKLCTNGAWGSCAGAISPAPEACDGLDNDCDGDTDEGCACVHSDTAPCGSNTGQCQQGTKTCVSGAWGPCQGEIAPAADGCDGLDNDCDGQTDEGCACVHGDTAPCGTNTGACQKGTSTCVSGAWGPCAGEIGPTSEVCNGEDDDCDGQVDEGVQTIWHPDQDDDGYGALGAGLQACTPPQGYVASATDCDDSNGAVHPGAPEICDAADNDCDGAVNEGGVCDACVTGENGTGTLCLVAQYDLPADYVQGVAWNWADGFLYVVALGTEMFRVSMDGVVETVSVSLGLPTDLTFNGSTLWVTTVFDNAILEVSPSGAVLATHPVQSNGSPLGIAWWNGDFRVLTNPTLGQTTYKLWTWAAGVFSNPITHSCLDVGTCVPGGMVKMNEEVWHSENGGAVVRRSASFAELDRFPTADLWEGMPTGVARSGDWLWVTVSIPGRLMKLVYIGDL